MNRLAILIASARLAVLAAAAIFTGCESVPLISPEFEEPPPAVDYAAGGCYKFRQHPSLVDTVPEGTICHDARFAEIVAAKWVPLRPGQCAAGFDGQNIKGGLVAVRYVWGCRK